MAFEANGWKTLAEKGEEYWEEQERHQAAAQAERERKNLARTEAYFRRLVEASTAQLPEDRLSYARICHLEWETGIRTGSWSERWTELGEAQLKDKESNA